MKRLNWTGAEHRPIDFRGEIGATGIPIERRGRRQLAHDNALIRYGMKLTRILGSLQSDWRLRRGNQTGRFLTVWRDGQAEPAPVTSIGGIRLMLRRWRRELSIDQAEPQRLDTPVSRLERIWGRSQHALCKDLVHPYPRRQRACFTSQRNSARPLPLAFRQKATLQRSPSDSQPEGGLRSDLIAAISLTTPVIE